MSRPERETDADLVERCLGGDEEAWDALIARYRRLIFAVPTRAGLSVEDSAEVFQNVCVELFQRLDRLRDPDCLPGWLTTTARRETWLVGRKTRRRETLVGAGGPTGLEDAAPDPTPLADVTCERLERAQILWNALDELPERCRAVLLEFLREDRSDRYADVAERLGLPRGSLGPTRARCFDRLRRILKRRGIGSRQ